jgi:hypothetical protein
MVEALFHQLYQKGAAIPPNSFQPLALKLPLSRLLKLIPIIPLLGHKEQPQINLLELDFDRHREQRREPLLQPPANLKRLLHSPARQVDEQAISVPIDDLPLGDIPGRLPQQILASLHDCIRQLGAGHPPCEGGAGVAEHHVHEVF